MPAKKAEGNAPIQLLEVPIHKVEVPIMGISPIIPHKWSEKSLRLMPGHPEAATSRMEKKGVRAPEEEANDCVYWLEDGRPAMPAVAFKAALVSACRLFDRPSMTEAKLMLFVEGVMYKTDMYVPFAFEGEPVLREDTPRNANGSADLRYRYAFYPWWTTLPIRYVSNTLTHESVIALVNAAGLGGVGDWRPSAPRSATGTFGMFRVMTPQEMRDHGGLTIRNYPVPSAFGPVPGERD